MEHLTGINIRIGIEELNLSIEEIFKPKTEQQGDERLKFFYEEGKSFLIKHPDLKDEINANQICIFSETKQPYKLTETLTAYVYDTYVAYSNKSNNNKIVCEKTVDIEFYNSAQLSFNEYCFNLMTAQAFSGNYEHPFYMYHFIGIGDFSLEEYASIHQLVVNTNCNMVYFFLYYKNVLASVENFITAGYEDDIKKQRKYLNDKEYRGVMKLLKGQRKLISAQMGDMDETDIEWL
jgi:hypothetical protein